MVSRSLRHSRTLWFYWSSFSRTLAHVVPGLRTGHARVSFLHSRSRITFTHTHHTSHGHTAGSVLRLWIIRSRPGSFHTYYAFCTRLRFYGLRLVLTHRLRGSRIGSADRTHGCVLFCWVHLVAAFSFSLTFWIAVHNGCACTSVRFTWIPTFHAFWIDALCTVFTSDGSLRTVRIFTHTRLRTVRFSHMDLHFHWFAWIAMVLLDTRSWCTFTPLSASDRIVPRAGSRVLPFTFVLSSLVSFALLRSPRSRISARIFLDLRALAIAVYLDAFTVLVPLTCSLSFAHGFMVFFASRIVARTHRIFWICSFSFTSFRFRIGSHAPLDRSSLSLALSFWISDHLTHVLRLHFRGSPRFFGSRITGSSHNWITLSHAGPHTSPLTASDRSRLRSHSVYVSRSFCVSHTHCTRILHTSGSGFS